MPKLELQVNAARTAGRREVGEELAKAVRANLNGWRGEVSRGSFFRRAVLSPHDDVWFQRLERLATAIEQHVETLRGHEQVAAQALAAEPEPAASRPARKPSRAKPKRAR